MNEAEAVPEGGLSSLADVGKGGFGSPWKVLVVDDEPAVHDVTALVLAGFMFEGRGIDMLHAFSGAEALTVFERTPDIAVALIDVRMEGDGDGLGLIRRLREQLGNRRVRIVLRTGWGDMQSERDIVVRYDINDYWHKTELSSQKLFSVVVTALRSYRDIVALERSQCGISRLLAASGALFQASSVDEFAETALRELADFLEAGEQAAIYLIGLSGGSGKALPAGLSIVCSRGDRGALRGRWEPGLKRLNGSEQDCIVDHGLVLLHLPTRYFETHWICAETGPSESPPDPSLLELFRVKATAALNHLLHLEQTRSAQRQSLRLLARLESVALLATNPGMSPSGDESDSVLLMLSIQAETAEWGESGALKHIERVGWFAGRLAELAGQAPDFCRAIARVAKFHDIGKLFANPSASRAWHEANGLSQAVAAEHCLLGGEFLRGIAGTTVSKVAHLAIEVAMHHHEAWDGSGYPAGLSGSAIPLAARIVALVDFYDTSLGRMGEEGGCSAAEICSCLPSLAGRYFDPGLVDIFLARRDEF